jgi:hypothetical protein
MTCHLSGILQIPWLSDDGILLSDRACVLSIVLDSVHPLEKKMVARQLSLSGHRRGIYRRPSKLLA